MHSNNNTCVSRLLKEMGWTEDDEEYVITEDDKKEMQKSIQLVSVSAAFVSC